MYWWDAASVLPKENPSWEINVCLRALKADWLIVEMEKDLKERFKGHIFVHKPAGGTVTPSYWSDSADGCDVCVRTEFTFLQCSVCHETLGATDMAVAFPVVPQSTQCWVWLGVQIGHRRVSSTWLEPSPKWLKLHFCTSWHCWNLFNPFKNCFDKWDSVVFWKALHDER